MKKSRIYVLVLCMMLLLSACQKEVGMEASKQENVQDNETIEKVMQETTNLQEEVLTVVSSVEFENRAFVTNDFTFADVSNLEFFFCSGAGGWWTQMYIHEDGTFDGYYVDSNWGITGEDYPNGQVSYSEFFGSFTEPLRVDDYTYQVQIDSIEYPKGKGSEIIDGVLFDYGEAYGLQGGENFYIYLPGKKYQELPEDFRLWVNGHYHWAWNGDSEAEDAILPFYGFFNVEQGCGFYSYEREP